MGFRCGFDGHLMLAATGREQRDLMLYMLEANGCLIGRVGQRPRATRTRNT